MEVRTVGCFGYVWDVGFFSSSSPVKSFFSFSSSLAVKSFFFLLFFVTCEEHKTRIQVLRWISDFDKIYVWRHRYPVTSFANRQSAFDSSPSTTSNQRAMLPPPTAILPASLTSFSLFLALAVSMAWPGPQRHCQCLAYGDDFWLLWSGQLRSRDF